jgi:hypothetical protein
VYVDEHGRFQAQDVLAGWLLSVSSLGHTWEEGSYRMTEMNECYTIIPNSLSSFSLFVIKNLYPVLRTFWSSEYSRLVRSYI